VDDPGAVTVTIDLTPAEAFRAQAQRVPDQLAIADPDTPLTYAELDVRSDRFAARLRTAGLGRGALVGVNGDRGADLYVAILGVAKCGAAFLPASADTRTALTGPPATGSDLDALAYVMPTSGSTGPPKAVMVGNRGVVNLARWAAATVDLTGSSRVAQSYPLRFDAAVQEIFSTLLAGATLYPVPATVLLSPRRLVGWLQENRITHFDTVPSYWREISRHVQAARPAVPVLPDLRVLVLGGETLTVDVVRPWLSLAGPDHRVFNMYGPTEATVTAAAYQVTGEEPGPAVPIGKPIWNTRLYVVGRDMRLCPPGVVGQLCIAGVGVARGYLDDPDRSQQAFVPDPFATTGRMFRTGDLARLTPDADLVELVGREGLVG
jgi:nonribosomal peptide synthetase protein VioF